jgi:hypothetical protein
MRNNETEMIVIARPGKRNHHHAPQRIESQAIAQRSKMPSEIAAVGPRPITLKAASDTIAPAIFRKKYMTI